MGSWDTEKIVVKNCANENKAWTSVNNKYVDIGSFIVMNVPHGWKMFISGETGCGAFGNSLSSQ